MRRPTELPEAHHWIFKALEAQALLGEMERKTGSVAVGGRVAGEQQLWAVGLTEVALSVQACPRID